MTDMTATRNSYNPNKPDCSHCNRPSFDQWATAHDPYGHRSVGVCDPCAEKAIEDYLLAEQMRWEEEREKGDN